MIHVLPTPCGATVALQEMLHALLLLLPVELL